MAKYKWYRHRKSSLRGLCVKNIIIDELYSRIRVINLKRNQEYTLQSDERVERVILNEVGCLDIVGSDNRLVQTFWSSNPGDIFIPAAIPYSRGDRLRATTDISIEIRKLDFSYPDNLTSVNTFGALTIGTLYDARDAALADFGRT